MSLFKRLLVSVFGLQILTPQRPGAYGTRCFSPDCDCDIQPGSCRCMPRGEHETEYVPISKQQMADLRGKPAKRPIGKRPELAAPYVPKHVPKQAPKSACRWPGECRCAARMGNDFFFLPLDICVS